MKGNVCSQCESRGPLSNLYGFLFCEPCEARLALHADKTILKNNQARDGYEDEVVMRLQVMEKDFVKKKVKLLHILERLGELT